MAFYRKQNEIGLCSEQPPGSGQYVCHTVFRFENNTLHVAFEGGHFQGRMALANDDPFREGGFWVQVQHKKYVHQSLVVPVLRSHPPPSGEQAIYCNNVEQTMLTLKLAWCANVLEHVGANDIQCEALVAKLQSQEHEYWNAFLRSIKVPSDADSTSCKMTAVRFVQTLRVRHHMALKNLLKAGKVDSYHQLFEGILHHEDGSDEAMRFLRSQVRLRYWKQHCCRATHNLLSMLSRATRLQQVGGVHDHLYYGDELLPTSNQMDAETTLSALEALHLPVQKARLDTDKLLCQFGMHKIPLEPSLPLTSTVITVNPLTLSEALSHCQMSPVHSRQLRTDAVDLLYSPKFVHAFSTTIAPNSATWDDMAY